MPMMKSPFDQQIVSLSGHSPEFKAGKPTWVPDTPMLVEECLTRGVLLCEDEEKPEPVAAPEEKSDNDNDAEAEFVVALDQALLKILTRDDPADLKSDLTPKVNKVVAEMSPDLRRPTATEIADAYAKLQENIDLAE